jgi:alpha,alpha-trehalase
MEKFAAPDLRFGPLFEAVQLAGVFPDSKTFVDCTPRRNPAAIMHAYAAEKDSAGFSLARFVRRHFDLPPDFASGFRAEAGRSIEQHIEALWPVLSRQPSRQTDSGGSLIELPFPYIVPGGRFGEIYYWDSYFTMLGLQAAGRLDMVEHMVDNFTFLIDRFGFIPNGNRTYFLSRSQPPFYALMVALLLKEKGAELQELYLAYLEDEYAFWMRGSKQASRDRQPVRRVVPLPDGSLLNRYWDDAPKPRQESYKEDVELAEQAGREPEGLFRDVRAACESGWDFSARWFRDGGGLAAIRTTELLPVDLNALLYFLESFIAKGYHELKDTPKSSYYHLQAGRRKAALLKYCWDAASGYFLDYDFVRQERTGIPSLATVFPLFFNMATHEQASSVAHKLERHFLKAGGLVSTLLYSGQQWDAPNGWAPLQWMAIRGLRNYGFAELAEEIKRRWIALNLRVYENTGKMVEKYNVEDMSLLAGGGEYPVQDGFGWSNGVLLRLLKE